ncbi:uncharacterized protein ACBT57_004617 [Dama dama]
MTLMRKVVEKQNAYGLSFPNVEETANKVQNLLHPRRRPQSSARPDRGAADRPPAPSPPPPLAGEEQPWARCEDLVGALGEADTAPLREFKSGFQDPQSESGLDGQTYTCVMTSVEVRRQPFLEPQPCVSRHRPGHRSTNPAFTDLCPEWCMNPADG